MWDSFQPKFGAVWCVCMCVCGVGQLLWRREKETLRRELVDHLSTAAHSAGFVGVGVYPSTQAGQVPPCAPSRLPRHVRAAQCSERTREGRCMHTRRGGLVSSEKGGRGCQVPGPVPCPQVPLRY